MLLTTAGPTNCTWALTVLNTTSSTIAISLTVSACAGSKPNYKIQAIASLSGAVTPAQQINSTMYEISSLMASTAYDVQLVDTECPNVIIERLQVLTDMDSSGFVINSFCFVCQLNSSCLYAVLLNMCGLFKTDYFHCIALSNA